MISQGSHSSENFQILGSQGARPSTGPYKELPQKSLKFGSQKKSHVWLQMNLPRNPPKSSKSDKIYKTTPGASLQSPWSQFFAWQLLLALPGSPRTSEIVILSSQYCCFTNPTHLPNNPLWVSNLLHIGTPVPPVAPMPPKAAKASFQKNDKLLQPKMSPQ